MTTATAATASGAAWPRSPRRLRLVSGARPAAVPAPVIAQRGTMRKRGDLATELYPSSRSRRTSYSPGRSGHVP